VHAVPGSYREAWASVTGNRNLRLSQLSSLSAWTGEFLFLSAMTVYAFDQDGAAGVGLVGFLRVLPATVALPVLGALADRVSRRRLLVVACALRALTAAGAALATSEPAVVYALLTVSTVCHAAFRPVLAALLTSLCTTPEELAGVNAVRAILDGLAALVGPLAAAALLAAYDAAAAFAAVALLAGIAGVLAAGLRYESLRRAADDSPPARAGVVADVVDGVRELHRNPRALDVIALGGLQCLVRGALTVLAVVVAVEVTDLGSPGVGVLWAAFGVGGFAAAMASIGAAGSTRLGTLFGAGIAMWGVPLVLVGPELQSKERPGCATRTSRLTGASSTRATRRAAATSAGRSARKAHGRPSATGRVCRRRWPDSPRAERARGMPRSPRGVLAPWTGPGGGAASLQLGCRRAQDRPPHNSVGRQVVTRPAASGWPTAPPIRHPQPGSGPQASEPNGGVARRRATLLMARRAA
jgi:MFS family permease